MESTPHEVVVGWRSPSRQVLMQLEPIRGEIRLYGLTAKKRYTKINGVSCISGQIRSMTGDTFTSGIKVAKTPWKVITLKKAEANDWKSILKELVNVQRKRSSQKTHVDAENWTVTIPVTIPLATIGEKSWGQMMDEFLKKQSDEVPKKSEPASAQKSVDSDVSVAAKVEGKGVSGSA